MKAKAVATTVASLAVLNLGTGAVGAEARAPRASAVVVREARDRRGRHRGAELVQAILAAGLAAEATVRVGEAGFQRGVAGAVTERVAVEAVGEACMVACLARVAA